MGTLRGARASRPGPPVSSTGRHIEETRRYLHDLVAYLARTSTAIELYEAMLSLHPNRVNPGSLWAAAKAFKGRSHRGSSEAVGHEGRPCRRGLGHRCRPACAKIAAPPGRLADGFWWLLWQRG